MAEGAVTPPAVPTTAPSRHAYIRELVHREGSVTVDNLVTVLGVSRMTVHRDLDALEAEHVLRKVRGGATATRSSLFESDWPYRLNTAVEAKRAIGRIAASLLDGGMAVLADESTTTLAALEEVSDTEPLTIITNSYPLITHVTQQSVHRLIALGGDYVPRYQAFLGMVCERAVRSLYADVLLASCSALRDLEIYHQDQQIVGAKRAMLEVAPVRILLADSSKFDVGAIYHLGSISDFTHLVTDDGVDPAVVERARDAGVDVRVASVERRFRAADPLA
ncbi:DeoR/GlpR family DNA-binding transcription regulator [Janibacter sp. G56]|uniref:DeoR/GlpR family DNA-binding transcription regulator n=1 Tax=Janibacter sp. G56 TaxID=3418717 RepID=UPI003D091725